MISKSWKVCASTLATVPIDGHVHRFSVSHRQSGRAPELEGPATLEWIGRFIGRIHVVGARKPFTHRLTLNTDTYGSAPRDWLLASGLIAMESQTEWSRVVNEVLDAVTQTFEAAGAYAPIRLHGDCHTGNVLWTDAGPHFVDLDDALMGPPMQDLWMLLSGSRHDMQQQLGALLAGYEDFMDFDWRQVRLVEALRALRMIHYSAWIARRWSDPAFPVAFPWFGGRSYWEQQIIRLREQLDALREPPLGGLPL